MPHNESDTATIARTCPPVEGVFRGPAHRWSPSHIDTPPDEFPAADRDDSSLRLWFLDDDDETGRIGDDLDLEYDGTFESSIEATIDDVAAEAEDGPGTDPVDFNTLSVRLYADVELRRLVHIVP